MPTGGDPADGAAGLLREAWLEEVWRAVLEARARARRRRCLVPQHGSGQMPGAVFHPRLAQLAAADAYEVDAYVRVEVPLRSGGTAWVYRLR